LGFLEEKADREIGKNNVIWKMTPLKKGMSEKSTNLTNPGYWFEPSTVHQIFTREKGLI